MRNAARAFATAVCLGIGGVIYSLLAGYNFNVAANDVASAIIFGFGGAWAALMTWGDLP